MRTVRGQAAVSCPLVKRVATCQNSPMPTYRLTIINEHFDQSVELDAPDIETARRKAIASGIAIAADLVSAGESFFGAELIVDDGKGQVSRQVISVGTSPLKGSKPLAG